MSREAKILIAIMVVIVGGMIALFTLGGKSNDAGTPVSGSDQQKLVRSDSHKLGSGRVTVVEFGDYQCPACGQAYPTTKRLESEFNGRITFVFRNFPLPMHPNAVPAAEAAEAAAAQGKFWEMNNKLYETQSQWSNSSSPADIFAGYAKDLGLDGDKVKQAVLANTYQGVIDRDKADGAALNIQGTPTFYINGKQASSFDYDTLKGMINNALK